MKDFTISVYKKLLNLLNEYNYYFQTFEGFIEKPESKLIILRHDVDKLPLNALRLAQIEQKLGLKGSYYFRAVPDSWDERIIKEIHDLGHEIGYHYENLTICDGDMKKAIEDFKYNLEKLRNLTPVSTICMHGSPQSIWDSKDLWKKFNYQDFDIIGEPYFDLDFSKVLYLTDTGRRWNGKRVSVRDKEFNCKITNPLSEKYNFRSTFDIIKAAEKGNLPEQIMFTFHPQRWSDKFGPWVKELVWQNVKNVGKWWLVKMRGEKTRK